MEPIRGRVWILGDDVDTDQMAPFATLTGSWEEARAAMLSRYRSFVEGVRPGDLLVAGRNFGCGSSRENAAENLKNLGVAAVVAESLARIFYRNCLAIGLPAVECPGVRDIIRDGKEAQVDLPEGRFYCLETGKQLPARPYTAAQLEIVEGGLMAVLQRRLGG